MEQTVFSRWFIKHLAYLLVAATVFGGILCVILTQAATDESAPAWSAPRAMAVRRVSQVTTSQSEPVFLSNIDCVPLTYRVVATSTVQTGCFTETAFGLLDSDSDTTIFNGTDEGLPLVPYTPHQVLAPWPKALDLIGLDPVDNSGTLVSLYKNPFAVLQDQRNFLGQLTAKKLTRAPDITLKDPSGKPLTINPQTMAFSGNGAWLVAETLRGAFVRINLATLSITAFAPAYGSQGSPALLKSRVAITDDGRFVAIANDIAAAFKVYDLATCDGAVNNLQPQNCRSYDYWSFVRQQIGSLQSIRHVRFVNEGLLSFDVITSDPSKNGTYELAPAGSITSLTDYIGLGDSYTSGEGAFDYLNGTDTSENACHVSGNSYPLLLAHDVFTSAAGHSVACSGTIIKDIGAVNGNYRGQVKNVASLEQLQASQPLLLESVEAHFVPGYIAQQRFVQRWQPRIVTVSVGGNDIGFGSILQNCVMPHISRHTSDNTCYNTYEDRVELRNLIDRTVPRWIALYNQLQREAPDMQLYAVGYPQVASDTGNCAVNVQLNKSELELAASTVDYLNQAIRKAAAAAHISYIDVSKALLGHRLCETASYNVAVNGLTAGKDAGPFGINILGKESFHPNALGHRLIEQAILTHTRNFTATSTNDTLDSNSKLLNAPISGQPINTLIPNQALTSGVGKRGATITVRANGADNGLRASTTYTVRLDGSRGTILGVIMSDSNGDLQGNIVIPINAVPGGHTIDITGENQSGESIDITQPIYIPASDADSDGDGIENIIDSCPTAINSGQDTDGDGIDDVCDSLIGARANPASPAIGGRTTTVASPAKKPPALSSPNVIKSIATATSPQVLNQHNVKLFAHKSHRPLFLLIGLVGLLFLGKRYIQKITFRLQWKYMSRVRKGFVYLLSLFLLATLLGTAVSTSTNNTFSKPKKIEQYLAESKLYDHFIAYTADQAKKTNGDNDQSGSVSLSDAAVQTAAQSSFPPKLIENSVNTVIDSNYAWLEGKTATPQFKIDLSAQKLTFAQKVGKYVTTYTAGLPVCANDQVALQQSQDPLAATCRPANVTPEAVGAQVTQRISTTGDFLSNPVVTANSINPEANQQSKPYYEKLQHVPKLYRFGLKLPYILGALSLLAALGIIFISSERRKGVRKVGIVLLIAGLSLVALKFFADLAFRRAENRVFSSASVGQLQKSLTDFAHRLETSMVRTELWFGIGFLLLAAIIFGVLAATRNKDGSSDTPTPVAPTEEPTTDEKSPIILARKRLKKTPNGLPNSSKLGGQPPTPPAPKPKKPPRLVQ